MASNKLKTLFAMQLVVFLAWANNANAIELSSGQPTPWDCSNSGLQSRHIAPVSIYDQALCLARNHSALDAAAYILAEKKLKHADLLPNKTDYLLAILYQNLGLPERAWAVATAEHTSLPERLNNKFLTAQAKTWLRLERPSKSAQLLQSAAIAKDIETREERDLLLALSHMHLSNYPGAIETLEAKQSFPKRDLMGHYNYAMALVHTGRLLEGIALLDEIGTAPVNSKTEQAIQDRANLQLGWQWLREEKGATARPIFKRISLHGPFSNSALLGLGWSELAPQDEPQSIQFDRMLQCPDIKTPHPDSNILLFYTRHSSYCRKGKAYPFRMLHQFAYEAGAKNKSSYLNALKYWSELSTRDIAEPAVQEAMLAIGYAYGQADDLERASQAYLRAVEAFAEEKQRRKLLQRALAFSDNNPLEIMGDPLFAKYFIRLRSSAAFNLIAVEHDTMQQLHTRLLSMQTRIQRLQSAGATPDARLQQLEVQRRQLAQAATQMHAQLQKTIRQSALALFEQENQDLETYQENAQAALAQLYSANSAPAN